MSVVLNGTLHTVPGLKTTSWVDPEAKGLGLKEVTHKTPRKSWVRGIVCHTHKGILGALRPGVGPGTSMDVKLASYQVTTDRSVSWDYTCDMNGEWLIQNDPLKFYTWQATSVNGFTLGFEMIQEDNGDLYEAQIQSAVLLVDFLTAKLGIQRQIPWDLKNDRPVVGTVKRILNGGIDVVGIYSHHHQTTNRGPGDCGPWLPQALRKAGYEPFSFDDDDDKHAWKARQQQLLGISADDADGVPGPKTVEALKRYGRAHGMWIPRPIDNQI